jgi:hypothetical protein
MDDDHIKRFNLSEKQPHRAFRQNGDAPLIKTKDNVHPVIPPPRTVFLPHPWLAPRGMMGSRLVGEAAKWKERQLAAAAETRSAFQRSAPKPREQNRFKMEDIPANPLVRDPAKSREWER